MIFLALAWTLNLAIDLNYRAVDVGARIVANDEAIVYHRARDTITKFLKQAYWNGYGRKQLTLKHGRLWGQYGLKEMVRRQVSSPWAFLRLGAGFAGYAVAKMRGGK